MSSVVSFAKRCCLLYFRDKGAVFFSLMASLIVVMLYLLFLRDSLISGNEGIRDMGHLVDAWVLSGILGITAVTCSAGALQTMVTDRSDGKVSDFKVTPMGPYQLAAGYVLSTFIVGLIMSYAILAIAVAYMAMTGCPISVSGTIMSAVLVIPAALSGSVIMFAISTFIRTVGAFSGMYTVVSVAIGFITGIYVPFGSMPSVIGSSAVFVPATQMSSLFRKYLAGEAMDNSMEGAAAETVAEFRTDMGFDLFIGDTEFTVLMSLLYVLAVTAVFFLIAVWSVRRKQ
ncbi:MAG: ABC transporter permease [Candidatus Methanomethylophilaceae archaeon]|nr:ABC transporter permease [Candidatus Methanomethylophilaceae archaeon]